MFQAKKQSQLKDLISNIPQKVSCTSYNRVVKLTLLFIYKLDSLTNFRQEPVSIRKSSQYTRHWPNNVMFRVSLLVCKILLTRLICESSHLDQSIATFWFVCVRHFFMNYLFFDLPAVFSCFLLLWKILTFFYRKPFLDNMVQIIILPINQTKFFTETVFKLYFLIRDRKQYEQHF